MPATVTFHQGRTNRHADLPKSSVDAYLKGGSITEVQMQALLDQFSKKKVFHLKFGPARIKKDLVFKDHGVPNFLRALTFFVKDRAAKVSKERQGMLWHEFSPSVCCFIIQRFNFQNLHIWSNPALRPSNMFIPSRGLGNNFNLVDVSGHGRGYDEFFIYDACQPFCVHDRGLCTYNPAFVWSVGRSDGWDDEKPTGGLTNIQHRDTSLINVNPFNNDNNNMSGGLWSHVDISLGKSEMKPCVDPGRLIDPRHACYFQRTNAPVYWIIAYCPYSNEQVKQEFSEEVKRNLKSLGFDYLPANEPSSPWNGNMPGIPASNRLALAKALAQREAKRNAIPKPPKKIICNHCNKEAGINLMRHLLIINIS